MARTQFGRTWWGSQWLNALQAVDWDNRLPRGRRYANNGSVRSLGIDRGMVTAAVKGSRARPYRVRLAMPAPPVTEVRRLVDDLAGDSALIGRLLNRALDPAVLERSQALGITIFPATWQDVDMHCSCPDWAVPCKHLAAVIYVLSREIDADPFQVFRLRGVDLIAELEQRGLHLAATARAELPDLHRLLAHERTPLDDPTTADPDRLSHIDYSRLSRLLDPLLQALPADPGFASARMVRRSWKTQLGRIMRRATAELEQLTGDATHDPARRWLWHAMPRRGYPSTRRSTFRSMTSLTASI